MAEPTTIAYQERLRVPWRWWLPALVATPVLATPVGLGVPGPPPTRSRSWCSGRGVRGAVQVVLDGPADPTPYGLVSTWHPDLLAAALGPAGSRPAVPG